jgi:hypothetical protein
MDQWRLPQRTVSSTRGESMQYAYTELLQSYPNINEHISLNCEYIFGVVWPVINSYYFDQNVKWRSFLQNSILEIIIKI